MLVAFLVFIGLCLLSLVVAGNWSKVTWAVWFAWSFCTFVGSTLYSKAKTKWNKWCQKGAKKKMDAPIMKPPPTLKALGNRKLINSLQ